jgi:hypothetical protein
MIWLYFKNNTKIKGKLEKKIINVQSMLCLGTKELPTDIKKKYGKTMQKRKKFYKTIID